MKIILLISSLFLLSCNTKNINDIKDATNGKTDGLEINEKRLFITSGKFDGNLNGITGANSKCMSAAQSAGLKRTYKAFISTSTVDAIDNFTTLNHPIYELDNDKNKILVSDSLTDFNAGTTSHDPVMKFDENGIDLNNQYSMAVMFWIATGTNASQYCLDWTSNLNSEYGDLGSTNSGEVIDWGNPDKCDKLMHLICISD